MKRNHICLIRPTKTQQFRRTNMMEGPPPTICSFIGATWRSKSATLVSNLAIWSWIGEEGDVNQVEVVQYAPNRALTSKHQTRPLTAGAIRPVTKRAQGTIPRRTMMNHVEPRFAKHKKNGRKWVWFAFALKFLFCVLSFYRHLALDKGSSFATGGLGTYPN